jgi:hypothetical protein
VPRACCACSTTGESLEPIGVRKIWNRSITGNAEIDADGIIARSVGPGYLMLGCIIIDKKCVAS